MENLKEETLKYIKAGKEIKLKWECGGDQAIITTFIDGEKISFSDEFAERLDIYLVNYLNLPGVGEFALDGEGELIEEDGKVYIEYESIMKGYVGYDEEKEATTWIKLNKKDEDWSGKKELFK